MIQRSVTSQPAGMALFGVHAHQAGQGRGRAGGAGQGAGQGKGRGKGQGIARYEAPEDKPDLCNSGSKVCIAYCSNRINSSNSITDSYFCNFKTSPKTQHKYDFCAHLPEPDQC